MNDCISRQAVIDDLNVGAELLRRVLDEIDIVGAERAKYEWGLGLIESYISDMKELPSAKKPFKLPEIYVADGYDTVAGEDGNVGFGVYVPDENQIYVAGDVEGEIRARALFHEVCHWVQAMCGRPFDEDEANRFAEVVYDTLPSAQPTPCDVCRHNPPSSMDGKPCCVCPAERRTE